MNRKESAKNARIVAERRLEDQVRRELAVIRAWRELINAQTRAYRGRSRFTAKKLEGVRRRLNWRGKDLPEFMMVRQTSEKENQNDRTK